MAARLIALATSALVVSACMANRIDRVGKDDEWLLVDLAGRVPVADSRVTLSIDPQGPRLFGFTGCNNYTTTASGTVDDLHVGVIGLTKRACLGDALRKQESRFVDVLRGATRVHTRGDNTLVVETADGALEFRRIRRAER